MFLLLSNDCFVHCYIVAYCIFLTTDGCIPINIVSILISYLIIIIIIIEFFKVAHITQSLLGPQQERLKRKVLRLCRKIVNDVTEVRCVKRLFHRLAVETGKARLPTVGQ